MFWKKKGSRLVDSLFKMYRIAHCAISDAHLNGIYSVKEYTEKHDSYINRMLDIASNIGGAGCAYKLSCICADYHEEWVKYLEKKREKMEANEGKNREKEKDSDMEGKYDGYVTTVTKSPVYSNRWQPTLSWQAWRPAIGEAGWHAREGEMGSAPRECLSESRLPHGGRLFGPESMYAGIDYEATDLEKKMAEEMLHGQTEKPAIKYIYHIVLILSKGSSIDVLNERDKLINVLKGKGFEAEKVYADTLSVHSEKSITEFEELIGPIYRSTGIQCGYEIKYKGKIVPIVRYEEEV